jgi:hypothetical protein
MGKVCLPTQPLSPHENCLSGEKTWKLRATSKIRNPNTHNLASLCGDVGSGQETQIWGSVELAFIEGQS